MAQRKILIQVFPSWKQRSSIPTKKKNFIMVPFHGWGSTASRLEPLRGGSLLFIWLVKSTDFASI